MKLYLRKNHGDLYPRLSCVWDGVEKSETFPALSKGVQTVIMATLDLLTIIGVGVISWVFRMSPRLIVAAFLFCLPLHECCHVLYCIFARREVEGIYFAPPRRGKKRSWNDRSWNDPGAYVMPGFCIHRKGQDILFRMLPLLLMTVVPTVIALFVPRVAPYLYFTAVMNLGMSRLDICATIALMRLPKNRLILYPHSCVLVPSAERMEFRFIAKKANDDKLIMRRFLYENKKLTELSFEHNESSRLLEQEFLVQFQATDARDTTTDAH